MKYLTGLFLLLSVNAFAQIEGYGKIATGGGTNPVCLVTNVAGTGPNSFSDCARRGNVNVQFNSPGPYLVDSQQTYLRSNTTIDGCANGQNGVTLDQRSDVYRGIIVEGPANNFIFRCLRFQGVAKSGPASNEHDLAALDGTSGPISQVAFDRCTFNQATDGGLDITGDVSDVTVQKSLFYSNPMTQLIKYDFQGKFPRNLSIHHNVYTQNGERNPQVRGGVAIDFVNNVVGPSKQIIDAGNGQPYSQYGTFLWNSNTSGEGVGNVKANIINNIYFGTFDSGPNACSGSNGITICIDSGASANNIFLSGNLCKAGPCPTSPAANSNPISSQVIITPVATLLSTLGNVGSPNKTSADQTVLNALVTTPIPTPTPTPLPTPTPTPTPLPTPTPVPTPKPTPTPVPCTTCPAGTSCLPPSTPCNTTPQIIFNDCGSRVLISKEADGSTKLSISWGFRSCSIIAK